MRTVVLSRRLILLKLRSLFETAMIIFLKEIAGPALPLG
jgi:hypothetical protein